LAGLAPSSAVLAYACDSGYFVFHLKLSVCDAK